MTLHIFCEYKVIELLIRKFFIFKCRFIRDADLNECGLNRMFIAHISSTSYLAHIRNMDKNKFISNL